MARTDVQNEPPADMDERIAVFLDCGNIDRMPVDFLQRDGQHIVNIDHHHDNTHFGTVNLVVGDASCTAEILWELAHALGVEITPSSRTKPSGDPTSATAIGDLSPQRTARASSLV